MAVVDGFEIPDELLESLAGGTLSDKDRAWLRSLATNMKNSGWREKAVIVACTGGGLPEDDERVVIIREVFNS